MVSTVKVDVVAPRVATGTTTLGVSGDKLLVPSGVTITNSGTATGFVSGFTSVQKFTASGTWTKPADITKILVFITGGGAAGTYISGSDGQGGGAGGTAIKFLDVSAISSVDVTIGSGGLDTGVGASPSFGNAGGASAFGVAPATVHCTAGGGAIGTTQQVPGVGGVGASGDLDIKGGMGSYAGFGNGGSSFWGGGTSEGYNGGYTSPVGVGAFGSGGGGARDVAAGDGADGVCFVMEFK